MRELWKGETELALEMFREASGGLRSHGSGDRIMIRMMMHHPLEAVAVLDSLKSARADLSSRITPSAPPLNAPSTASRVPFGVDFELVAAVGMSMSIPGQS